MNCLRNRHNRALRAATTLAVAALVSLAPLSGSAETDDTLPTTTAELAAEVGIESGIAPLPDLPSDDAPIGVASDAPASVASLVFGDTGFDAPSAERDAAPLADVALENPPSTSRLAATLFLGAGLVLAGGWFVQRRKGNLVTGAIRHVQSYKLGARQQVSLVQVDGRRLLLGVTADGVVLLGDMTDAGPLTPGVLPAAPVALAEVRESDSIRTPRAESALRAVATVTNKDTQRATTAPPQGVAHADATVDDDDVAQQWFNDGDEGRLETAEVDAHPHAFSVSGLEDGERGDVDASWSEAFADAMRTATAGASPPAQTTRAHDSRQAPTTSTAGDQGSFGLKAAQPMTSYPPPSRFARTSSATPTAAPLSASMTPPTRATSALRVGTRGPTDSDRSRERDGVLARLETLRSRGATR
ncbi:MAG: flagellar protein FliO/FliZ [Bradymonadia bacterium]|jgi:flagellar protein FliO/FliZ